MRSSGPTILKSLLFVSVSLLVGCGKKDADGHGHGAEKTDAKSEAHAEEAPSGASFKGGKGVMLTEEMRKLLAVETADVAEEKIPSVVRFSVQVYADSASDADGSTLRASGTVPQSQAPFVMVGQRVTLSTRSGSTADAKVVEVHASPTAGESEVNVAFKAADGFGVGDFPAATISSPQTKAVAVVPKTALLKTSEGTFVYAVNGEAFYRTEVKTGAENETTVEIVDGLLAGDAVVTKSVETLWLIELRATKGGGHSH